MKFEISLVLLCVINYTIGVPVVLDCIRDIEDFEMYNWIAFPTFNYAEDSSELPGAMKGAIHGRGIFYVDGASQGSVQKIYKPREYFSKIRPTYIYVKYYAHIENVTDQRIYATPALAERVHDLPHSPNFTWREALVEIDVDNLLLEGVTAALGQSLVRGDFLLVDTIIFAQGANISDIDEIKTLCSPEIEPTPITEPSTTTERPSDSILECIDNQQDFDSDGWSSYPTHKYAQNSSSLPAGLGNLTGEGIFYFNELPPSPHHVFFKDYSSQFEGHGGPAYVYLKYYVHLTRNNQQNQTAYIQPVQLVPFVPGEYSLDLGPSTGFVWQEKLLEIDTRNTIVGSLMEIGIFNIQPGELLLIDKIIVSRGSTLTETLQQIMSCLSEENVLIQNLLSWADKK